MNWYGVKEWLAEASGLGMDALHVHAGVLGLIAFAILLRRRLSSPWPWLAVAAVTFANEYYDLRYEVWPNRDDQLGESARDVWTTLLLPTLLLMLARFAPALFGVRAASASDAGEAGPQAGEAGEEAERA